MPTLTPEPLALLGQVGVLVEQLQSADLGGLTGPQVLEFTAGLEVLARRLPTVQHKAVAEIEQRHLAAEKRLPNTAAMLTCLLRLDPRAAKQRVTDHSWVGPRVGLTGEPLPAILPATAAALADGTITVEHVRVITGLIKRLDGKLTIDGATFVEQRMLDAAAHTSPYELAKFAVQVEARLNPDGTKPSEKERAKARHVTLFTRPDGSAKLTGELDPYTAAALQAVLATLSRPEPAEDGTRDERSPGQRRHDGLKAACRRLLRSGTLPATGGCSTTILVTIDHKDLLAHLRAGTPGYGQSSFGQLISIETLLQHAADTEFIPVILNDAGGIMNYGRSKRLFTPEQRRAITARDQGCVRDGCSMPAEWSQIHHVTEWRGNGQTDINDGAMICDGDHEWLDRGAKIVMIDGVPHWVDPPWLDPSQTPRRNTTNHPHLDFLDLDQHQLIT